MKKDDSKKTVYAVDSIQETAEKMLRVSLNAKDPKKTSYAWEFMQGIYKDLCKHYCLECDIEASKEKPFTLFSDNLDELFEGLKEVPLKSVQNNLKLKDLVFYVMHVAYANGDKTCIRLEVEELRNLHRWMGNYFKEREKLGEMFNTDFWRQIYSSPWLFDVSNIPKGCEEGYAKDLAFILFDFYFGLLKNGYNAFLTTAFYDQFVVNQVSLETKSVIGGKYETFLTMAAHSYLYYLFNYAAYKRIEPKEADSALELFTAQKVRNAMNDFVEIKVDDGIVNEKILNLLETFLNQYEYYPRYYVAHRLYCGQAAREYYLFCVSYVAWKYRDESILKKTINADDFKIYVQDGEVEDTRNIFVRILLGFEDIEEKKSRRVNVAGKAMDEDVYYRVDRSTDISVSERSAEEIRKLWNEPEVQDKAKEILDFLKDWIRKEYKEQEQEEARKESAKYMADFDEEKTLSSIRDKVRFSLCEEYAPAIRNNPDKECLYKQSVTVPLLAFDNLTSGMTEGNLIETCVLHTRNDFADQLLYCLLDKNIISCYSIRDKFEDDKAYLTFLSENSRNIFLLGSEFVLKNIDYRNIEQYRTIEEGIQKAYAYSSFGIILYLDAIAVEIEDISVNIGSPSQEEILRRAVWNEDMKKYVYEIYSGFKAEFDKEELISYVKNKRKIVKIEAKLNIYTYKEDVGFALKREGF